MYNFADKIKELLEKFSELLYVGTVAAGVLLVIVIPFVLMYCDGWPTMPVDGERLQNLVEASQNTPETVAELQEAIKDGKISKWEWRRIRDRHNDRVSAIKAKRAIEALTKTGK